MKFYDKTATESLKLLKSSNNGLSVAEARKRLARNGPNVVTVAGVPWWQKVIEPFANVMVLVLVFAGVLSLMRGNHVDAAIIFVVIMASAVIDWVQQYSTERILRRLREQENDNVEVVRDGNTMSVPSENLVVGDIILVQEGQKVPADARIIVAEHLHTDESMLTGESLSVHKDTSMVKGDREVYDQSNMLFSGSFVVVGSGQAVVTATGNDTEFGRLAKLAGDPSYKSPIQEKIDKLVKNVVIVIFVLAVVVLVLEMIEGQSFLDSLQFVLAFAVSAVPESLPIAITAVLALGMKRMAVHKSLVRNMRAIENVGLTTVVATDKTGTLTRNELRVQETWSPRFNAEAFALQTSFALNSSRSNNGDPLDKALMLYLKSKKIGDPRQTTKAKLIANLPFDYIIAMSGNVWQFGKSYEIYLKGAPEKILSRCKLTKFQLDQANKKLTEYAKNGYRVIAYAKLSSDRSVKILSDVPDEGLEFIGFTAIADEMRPRIDQAVAAARGAGVKVCMITGDHADTALHIAKEVGIAERDDQVYDCRKLMKLTPTELAAVVAKTRVYARVTPEAKHKILSELNKNEITAMTGDGVNDVPALTQANVGIAMGSGAAIAKDASDMVLLDDNFRTIVVAIREGRTIIANIRRMLVYLLATNAGEVLVTLGALLIGVPLPLVAVQILWINLATDTFMVIPLGIEPARGDIMKHKPAKPNAPILNKYMIGFMSVSAVTIMLVTLSVFIFFRNNYNDDYARSAVFLTLIAIQWVNALVMRGSESVRRILRVSNKPFWLALLGTMILQIIIMCIPALRTALHIEQIHGDTIFACLIGVIVTMLILEAYKAWGRRKGWSE